MGLEQGHSPHQPPPTFKQRPTTINQPSKSEPTNQQFALEGLEALRVRQSPVIENRADWGLFPRIIRVLTANRHQIRYSEWHRR